MATPRDILEFWFSDRARQSWFESDPAFDAEIATLFGAASRSAQLGRLEGWTAGPDTTLALLLLLDQFPRNMYRGQAKAFLGDQKALDIARRAIAKGFDQRFGYPDRLFFYLPFEHAEDVSIQEEAVRLICSLADEFGEVAAKAVHFARLHQDVIRRFGRFPGRNAALGRTSTEAEMAFLNGPSVGF